MVLNVILGVTVDTPTWIKYLLENEADHIVVVDYDKNMGEPEQRGDIRYLSPFDTDIYMNNFDSIKFYKSMYGYPGMGGNMTSFYRRKKDDVEE